jgi:hypothetical protein
LFIGGFNVEALKHHRHESYDDLFRNESTEAHCETSFEWPPTSRTNEIVVVDESSGFELSHFVPEDVFVEMELSIENHDPVALS